jgi:hypothetical protein
MPKLINYECGDTDSGETDDHRVANHPDAAGKVTREDFLAMAEGEPAS